MNTMNPRWINVIFRILLSLSLIYNPITVAQERQVHGIGDVVPQARSPEGYAVRYVTNEKGIETDSAGRPRVIAPKTINQGTISSRYGVLEKNGSITWDGAFHSRSNGQTNYPNYPEVKSRPSEPGRALVPVGPVIDASRPPGHSGLNSPVTEYLPEFDSRNKPSRLHQSLEWTNQKTAQLKSMLRGVINGTRPLPEYKGILLPENFIETESQRRAEIERQAQKFAGSAAGTFTYTAVVFYTALGFVSAYTLMRDYPNNPLAWDSYLQSLSDPVGWAALAGFLAGSAWFFKKMDGTAHQGKFLRQLPFFAGALLAGTLVSTPISVLGNDKDFLACAGFTNYKTTNEFRFDYPACDRLYTRWTTESDRLAILEQITLQFVPVAANVVLAGGLYLGAVHGTKFLINRPALAQALRAVPIAKTPRNGLIGIGLSALQLTVFFGAYGVTTSVFGVEKGVKELWLTRQNILFSNEYGTSMNDAESNLLEEWARVKKSGWKSPDSWDKLCFDQKRKKRLFYDCEHPDRLDFVGILDRYSKLNESWRALQMQETMQAYKAWTQKVEEFNSMVSTAYKFYKQVIDQLAQPSGKIDLAKLKLSNQPTQWGPWTKNYDDHWKYIFTPKLDDFLLTSMACGPEVEGYAGSSTWENTRQWLKWVTGNSHPKKMIKDKTGFTVRFFPPRITTALPGTSDTICEHTRGLFQPLDLLVSPPKELPLSVILSGPNANYIGIPAYLEKNIRSSVFTPDGRNRFEEWWSEYVAQNAQTVITELRDEYKKMLDTTFKTALTRNDYYWCDPGANVKDTGLEKYLRRLSTSGEACGAEALHRLPYGIMNSLRDELKLYLAMLIDMFMNNAAKTPGGSLPGQSPNTVRIAQSTTDYENAIVPRAKALVEKLDLMMKQVTISEAQRRMSLAEMKENTMQMMRIHQELQDIVTAAAMNNPSLPQYQFRWSEQLLKKSFKLLANYVDYLNITTTFEAGEN